MGTQAKDLKSKPNTIESLKFAMDITGIRKPELTDNLKAQYPDTGWDAGWTIGQAGDSIQYITDETTPHGFKGFIRANLNRTANGSNTQVQTILGSANHTVYGMWIRVSDISKLVRLEMYINSVWMQIPVVNLVAGGSLTAVHKFKCLAQWRDWYYITVEPTTATTTLFLIKAVFSAGTGNILFDIANLYISTTKKTKDVNPFEFNSTHIATDNVININCWGNSFTMGSYPTKLQALVGKRFKVNNFGVGGENSRLIAGRQGGYPLMLKNAVALPANTTNVLIGDTTDSGIYSIDGIEVKPLLQGTESNSQINPCFVNGVECTISFTAGSYYIKRNVAGVAMNTVANSIIYTNGMKYRDGINIFEVGANGGYVSDADLILQHKKMVEFTNGKCLITLHHAGTEDNRSVQENKFFLEFTSRVFNFRKYVVNYGLADAGLTPTTEDLEAIALGSCPPQLKLPDGVHLTETGNDLLANQVYKHLKQLNYLTV
jgi:hypothetical protein